MTEGDPMPDNETDALHNVQGTEQHSDTSESAAETVDNIHGFTDQPEPETAAIADDPESFPREYVLQLRDEAAKYRVRSRWADELGQRLHVELVRATGRLADPTDLPYREDYLQDPEALAKAIDDLLARKPHLASRKPVGEIGQGAAPSAGSVDLAGMLRQRAR
jgi:hypothetical protein